jgi:hypothetical protein
MDSWSSKKNYLDLLHALARYFSELLKSPIPCHAGCGDFQQALRRFIVKLFFLSTFYKYRVFQKRALQVQQKLSQMTLSSQCPDTNKTVVHIFNFGPMSELAQQRGC